MILKSLENTKALSKKISKVITKGDVILLYGEIGVGKTTFARFLINDLEKKKKLKKSHVLSPTFNIVYDYDLKNSKIFHYDLYRLNNTKDILELGMFEDLNKNIKIIEWPKLIVNKPKNRIELYFKYSKKLEYRNVNIIGIGKWRGYKFSEIIK